jgi:hypothetical protein
MSETRTEDRLGRLETTLARIEATLTATLPTLATKAELTTGLSEVRGEIADVKVALADKPGRGYLWGVVAAMVGAQAVAFAAAALLFSTLQTRPAPLAPPVPHASAAAALVLAGEPRPYSCRLLDDEQRKCAFGSCDARTVERLRNECLRDGGRP